MIFYYSTPEAVKLSLMSIKLGLNPDINALILCVVIVGAYAIDLMNKE